MAGASSGGDGDLKGSKVTSKQTRLGPKVGSAALGMSKKTGSPPVALPGGTRRATPKSVVRKPQK